MSVLDTCLCGADFPPAADYTMGACFEPPLPSAAALKPEPWWDWAADVKSKSLRALHEAAGSTEQFKVLLAHHRQQVLSRSYSAGQRAKSKMEDGKTLSLVDRIALLESELRALKALASRKNH